MVVMNNEGIAKIFFEIADYLDMEGVPFKPNAYRNAAQSLESLGEDVDDRYRKGGYESLKTIPAVGEAIARKIEEYLNTGSVRYHEELKSKTPLDLNELLAVEGLGPKRTKALYDTLGVRTVADLEQAARKHRIAGIPGFGEKAEKNILQGIVFLKKDTGRFKLGQILPKAKEIVAMLSGVRSVKKISIAGSLRRGKETIGDADLLAVSDDGREIMDAFTGMDGIEKIWGKGATKSSIRLKKGFDIDLRVVPESAYGSALQYFTGSKDHNIKLRTRAIERGLKLNEYGVFKGKDMLPSASEEEVYGHLGLPWIPPELREDTGEIEAAAAGKLPALVTVSDIQGDLHCHSDWDGGTDPIMELVNEARARGYSYIGISDHTKFLKIEKGLDEKKLMERNREIDRLNKTLHGFRILKGCEANIMNDGTIDIDDTVLARMDYVIAGVHSNLRMDEREMTARLTRAMENPHVDIISHPTGRLIGKREEYRIRTDTLISVAARTGTILEVNSFPDRLDLNDRNIRHAIREGVKLVINTDSHSISHMNFMELGVMQARRGWAQKQDIANTYGVEKLLECMKG